jgi:hypothetical protein
MPLQTPSPTLLNARYVAIRTAEARNMTDRLLQAARDRTPGVRRLLAASSAGLTLVLVCTLAPRGITDGEGPRGE